MSSARKARTTPDRTDFFSSGDAGTAMLCGPPMDPEDVAYYVRHHLTRTERLVVMLRYAEELAFDEIADVLKIARDEVEQIHALVVDRLQTSLVEAPAAR